MEFILHIGKGNGTQTRLIILKKAKELGFDILEISCVALKNIDQKGLDRFKETAREHDMILTAGYGPAASENLASPDDAIVKNAIAFYTDILKN